MAFRKSCWIDSLGDRRLLFIPQQAEHRHAPTRCPSPARRDGNQMTLISCPELLKHFLFRINSNKEEGKAGIRLHRGGLILIFLQSCSPSRKTSWHVSPPRFFQCKRSADRLFKCYSRANLVPPLTHQLPRAWKANRLCSSLGDPS